MCYFKLRALRAVMPSGIAAPLHKGVCGFGDAEKFTAPNDKRI